jgi:cellulose synthase/poly-beta-1,6-N-acetylglucosamine synthase-like glycosyltransferase/peptidoglycan/xylan/chitin deacetylase (PgdA/CDA1 family)
VIYRQGHTLASRELPAHTVALTFDDGPDRRCTPQILAVLGRERVPATFFAIGSRVVQNPGLVRRELAAGDEVGSHTFTHANLTNVPAWQESLELSLAQDAIAGATGRHTELLRPPYSSEAAAVTRHDLPSIQRAVDAGYLVVLADRDTEDWRRPGWQTIVNNALPSGGQGVIIMFHDGGGDRSQTVQALPRVIDALRADGYRFTTVTGGVGLAPLAADRPVSAPGQLQGVALVWTLRVSAILGSLVEWVVLPLGALALLRTLAMLALARHRSRRPRLPKAGYQPAVTVVVPAYNEVVNIAATVRSLAANDYPGVEVVVVDDGSTDGTAEVVARLGLSNVRLVSQPNAGKATALNSGIAASTSDVVVLVDGDTVAGADTVFRLVQPLADPRVGAVAGNTKVGNRQGLLGRWQHLEYVVAFNLDRRMFDVFGCITTVPGAVGAFRRDVLNQAGGVSTDTLAEDTDLTMAVQRAGYQTVYAPDAVAWTEAPQTIGDLWRQRYRWCYGTMQAIWKHRGAVCEHGTAGRLGRIGLPLLVVFQVLFPLLSPALDLFAVFGLIFLDPFRVAAAWAGFLLLQLFTCLYGLRLDGERLRAVWVLPLQQFVYRQVMYLVVIQSAISALSGVRLRWHKLQRSGHLSIPSLPGRVPPLGHRGQSLDRPPAT